jgi:hypothetical protein
MRTDVNLPVDATKKSSAGTRVPFWRGGVAVRTIFLVILTVITARVASPQLETLRSVLETPSDLLRVGLGFTACLWLVANVFILPKDREAYRTWLYLGPAVLPLSLLCAFYTW